MYPEELVHCELMQQIAKSIAHVEMGGGAGVKSELNFCLYCHSRLLLLPVLFRFRWEGNYRTIITTTSNIWSL